MKKLFKTAVVLMMAAFTVSFISCSKDDKNILDYSAQELAEAAKVKMNDWSYMGLKGSVKEYTEIEYDNAEMNPIGSLIKNDATYKYVYAFNTAGFVALEEDHYRSYDYMIESYSNLRLMRKRQHTYNEQNQKIESRHENYYYANVTDVTPNVTYYYKYTYTYDATTATAIRESSEDNINWIFDSKTVYLLDEYGRIDEGNEKVYYANEEPTLQYEYVLDRKKDEVGNVTSALRYYKSYNPEYYSLNFYTEYTYVY